MATEFVRVKDPDTGHEVTVPRRFAEANNLDVLKDKDAVDSNGRPLPGKPRVELPKADKPTASTTTNAGHGQQNGGTPA
jgi:hypothetical protein